MQFFSKTECLWQAYLTFLGRFSSMKTILIRLINIPERSLCSLSKNSDRQWEEDRAQNEDSNLDSNAQPQHVLAFSPGQRRPGA